MRRRREGAAPALHVCAACGRGIAATVADPVVCSPSLGRGFYHEACARAIWARQRREAEAREAATHAARVANGRRFAAR